MFTAEEYRTAAKVLQSEVYLGSVKIATYYDELAQKAQRREEYAATLGRQHRHSMAEPDLNVGLKIIWKLLEDGWTPPEGLF